MTNAEARFNVALRPQKQYSSLERKAQPSTFTDIAPELWQVIVEFSPAKSWTGTGAHALLVCVWSWTLLPQVNNICVNLRDQIVSVSILGEFVIRPIFSLGGFRFFFLPLRSNVVNKMKPVLSHRVFSVTVVAVLAWSGSVGSVSKLLTLPPVHLSVSAHDCWRRYFNSIQKPRLLGFANGTDWEINEYRR